MDTDDVRGRLDDLGESIWALAVVSASAESGLLASLASPRRVEEAAELGGMPAELARRLLEVLVALGFAERTGEAYVAAEGLRSMLTADGLEQLCAELRTTLLQSRDLVARAIRHELTSGWVHTDPELLHAQGTSGLAAARTMAGHGVQRMAGLAERLAASTASFLDVGAGVGVIAIEMCRAYPSLRVVGLEPAEAPRRQALDRIAAAGFSDRIEIRGQGVEALTDVEEFDFAYLPQVFLSEDTFIQSLTTVLRALRRGGWAALPVISVTGDDLAAALARLRNTLWGGGARLPQEVAAALTGAGFTQVQVRSTGSTRHAIFARRPE